jgi:hypothetical protein
MTYTEIIEKLKTLYSNVAEFANDEAPYNPNNYREALQALKDREDFKSEHYINYRWDTPQNNKFYNDMPNPWAIAQDLYNADTSTLKWEEVDSYGGEGQGETWYSVKYFRDYDVYIKVDGYYTSYNGVEFDRGWDSCKEVRPKQKTITVYN